MVGVVGSNPIAPTRFEKTPDTHLLRVDLAFFIDFFDVFTRFRRAGY